MNGELIERLAELEHEQWMEWSQAVADEVSPERRVRWEKYWVPYDHLSEEVKERDREWARKVVRIVDGLRFNWAETVNGNGLTADVIQVDQIVVKDEADVKRIAEELGKMNEKRLRRI